MESVNNMDIVVAQRSLGFIKQILWGAELWKGICEVCTKPDAAIQVWPVFAHSPFTLPGNYEADILAQAQALLLEEMLTTSDVAECVHCK